MKVQYLCSFCRHEEEAHERRIHPDIPTKLENICWECEDWEWAKYHAFKLDNLKLIEDMAKAKGLI